MADEQEKNTVDTSGAFGDRGSMGGAMVVVPDRKPVPSMDDFPVKAMDPVMMPVRDSRADLDLPHESHEYTTNDGVVSNRDDFGASMGRSFRVGWGPGGMLVYNFTSTGVEKATTPVGTLQIQTVSVSKMTGDSSDDETMTRSLATRLQHNTQEAEGMDDGDSAVLRLLEAYLDSCDSDAEKHVWQLVHCLYLGDTSKDVRQAVSTWLQQVTRSSKSRPSIVELLACRQIEEACEAAVEQRDFRLAALVAQADGPSALRSEILQQVRHWKVAASPSTMAPGTFWDHMKAPERHVYAILSGDFDTTQQDLGISPETLGWRSCLGLHLWYKFGGGTQSATTLKQLHTVMDSYDTSWQAQTAPRPRPSYALPSCAADQVHDVCYTLLHSYARGPVTLDPRAHRPAVLDCSFVWHLQSLLADIAGADGAKAALPPQKLHTDFIFQLEARGLLRWAIYVATQWRPESGAGTAVPLEQTPLALELLCRYAPKLSAADLVWLRDEVGLPLGWLTYARALTAASVGDAVAEAIRLAETLAEMGGTSSSLWPFRRPLLAFAEQMRSALGPEVELLVAAADADAAETAAAPFAEPFAEPLCRWARQRLRAVALSRLAPCFAAASRRRASGEADLGGSLARLLRLLSTVATQADLALPSASVRMPAVIGAPSCTACALEGAFLACQTVRERGEDRAGQCGEDGRRSPTRPRLSPNSSTEPMDEEQSESEDLWCAAAPAPRMRVPPDMCGFC